MRACAYCQAETIPEMAVPKRRFCNMRCRAGYHHHGGPKREKPGLFPEGYREVFEMVQGMRPSRRMRG